MTTRFQILDNEKCLKRCTQGKIAFGETICFFADVECLIDLCDWEAKEIHLNDCSFHFDAKHTKATLMLFTRGEYFVPRALL